MEAVVATMEAGEAGMEEAEATMMGLVAYVRVVLVYLP